MSFSHIRDDISSKQAIKREDRFNCWPLWWGSLKLTPKVIVLAWVYACDSKSNSYNIRKFSICFKKITLLHNHQVLIDNTHLSQVDKTDKGFTCGTNHHSKSLASYHLRYFRDSNTLFIAISYPEFISYITGWSELFVVGLLSILCQLNTVSCVVTTLD